MKKVLVTGGAGYIGAHVVNKLKDFSNIEIHVVDILKESKNNIITSKGIYYYQVDIRNKEELSDLLLKIKPDVVMHFAAIASVPDSMVRPFEYYETNVIGGINLLEAMRNIGLSKIVFSSSASTYGEPKSESIKEDHPQSPTNTYGYTKLVFENILKDYNRAYGFSSISFRYFCAAGCDTTAGLGEYHSPETHVIPSMVETALGKREKFFVYGKDFNTTDGTGVRDYIHVNDLADAHILAMSKLFTEGNVCKQYNLGINKGFSVMELIKSLEKMLGCDLNFEIKDRRPGDPSKLIADSTLAQKELGWKPKFLDIADIVKDTYISFKNR